MEPLQEAIERARLQREGTIGKTVAPGTTKSRDRAGDSLTQDSTSVVSESKPRSNEDARPLPLPSQVRYSTTRLIEPSAKNLLHNRVIAGEIHDPRVEAYRQLRTQVLAEMKRHDWRSLALTSAHEDAGKTLTAVNLAICIAQEANQTVLLVDLDLRTPSVHTTLGIDITKGIVDHLLHDEPIENILINPGYPRLVVLPGLPQGRYSSEMLTSSKMKSFMTDITSRYPDRIIIFDLPPLLRNDDAIVFVPNVDACLFVVEDGATKPEDIERSMQLLKHSQLIGTVLNKAR
jgi:protein-tyrosine kinase